MRLKPSDALCGVAVLVVAALAAYLYPAISDPMPTHFNADGAVDGYSRKPWGVVLVTAAPLFVFLVFKALPLISPRGFRMDAFQAVTDILGVTVTMAVAGIGAAVLLRASGKNVPLMVVLPIVVGATFVVIGNYLGKLRKNFFVGIRTPWTLASDEVWARTHRVSGWLFVLAGLVILSSAGYPGRFPTVLISATVTVSIIAVAYSFVVYRKLHGLSDR